MTPIELVKLINNDIETNKYYIDSVPHSDLYYKVLMSYCKLFSPKRVMEIGHCYGYSSVYLARYANLVDSFDSSDIGRKLDRVILPENVNFVLLSSPNSCLELDFFKYDFIFIDIDHSGVYEMLLHEQLLNSNYSGFVFWDDIFLNDGMKKFWQMVENDKVETNWHFSGFGIVKY